MRVKVMALMVLSSLAGVVTAQQPPAEKRELIYCADLMTHEEREAYRAKMQAAPTYDEKRKIRAEHQTAMHARAVSQGRSGECVPQGQGPGLGRGPGQGLGTGQGGLRR